MDQASAEMLFLFVDIQYIAKNQSLKRCLLLCMRVSAAKSAVFCRMHIALMPSVSVYGSDCVDKTHTGILQDIIAETAYANTGVLAHIAGEICVMISLFEME